MMQFRRRVICVTHTLSHASFYCSGCARALCVRVSRALPMVSRESKGARETISSITRGGELDKLIFIDHAFLEKKTDTGCGFPRLMLQPALLCSLIIFICHFICAQSVHSIFCVKQTSWSSFILLFIVFSLEMGACISVSCHTRTSLKWQNRIFK